MQKSVIIVAGGSGKRMNADIPKQFIEIKGKPILMHTIEKFYAYDYSINIIVVLPELHIEYWNKLVEKYNFKLPIQIVKGGESRFESVKNGLKLIKNGIVGIHDAVRPLVSSDTIKRAYEAAILDGNAIPCININDSLRIINNSGSETLNRNHVRIVQTPQCFEVSIIKKAYLQDYNSKFTDDASVLENSGIFIHLVEGNHENIKITRPLDIKIAEALLH